uniref:Meiosis specific with OB-fold n=1 Tax=Hippocampus comes TaxID=109280 RepID=A0A3Q2XD15_HIPCM
KVLKMAAINHNSISELHPKLLYLFQKVIGIIIGKTDIKGFPDRKIITLFERSFSFTDSPDFFINVSAWGSDGYINRLCSSFSIGDVVIIENPLVTTKDLEKEERFCPTTPSPYRLMLAEAHSQMCLCVDVDTSDSLLPLIHMPVKDSRDFYPLGDIVANGKSLDGSFINILAAVKAIGEMKLFRKSDGCQGQRMEVKLFDELVSSFPLIWWVSYFVFYLLVINFDSFRNGMTAAVNSKTIITVNPGKRVTASFHQSITSITAVYTVGQLKEKSQESPETSHGITYSFISKLDLDSCVSKVIRTRWYAHSGRTGWVTHCNNFFSSITGFDLMMNLTDHTGTLHACTLRSPVAEAMLGCTTEQFTHLTDNERTAMKWKFLLERCKTYVKVQLLFTFRLKDSVQTHIINVCGNFCFRSSLPPGQRVGCGQWSWPAHWLTRAR